MNKKLLDAMEHISDSYIADAIAPKKTVHYSWLGAVAAILVIALIGAIIFPGLGSAGDPSSTTAPILQVTTGSSTAAPTIRPTTRPTTRPVTRPSSAPASRPTNQHTTAPSNQPSYPRPSYRPTAKPTTSGTIYGPVAAPVYAVSAGAANIYTEGTKDALSNIANAVLSNTNSENPVCSPLNIYMALSMLAEISDGKTRQQIVNTLGHTDLTALRSFANRLWQDHYADESYKTVLANSLWLDDGISYNQDTANMLALYYFASVYRGDLSSSTMQQSYKSWLNKETGGLLEDEIERMQIDPHAIIFLASTIYYEAGWNREFSKTDNTQAFFHTPDQDVYTTFMNTTRTGSYYYYEGENYRAAQLFLKDGSSMWLILPDEGVDPLAVADAYQNATEGPAVELHLSVPKFDITAKTDLKKALMELGMTELFSNNADFSAITSSPTAPLQSAEHAARVAIDEEGVIGAAYTSIAPPGSAPPVTYPVVNLTFDRPFTFSVVSSEGLPLFTGVVNNPAA